MKRLFSFLILFSLITLMFFQSCGERSVEEEVIIRSIGDPYQGGIIAYLLKSDDAGYEGSQQHGLIVALEDQGGMDVLWWNEVLGDLETKNWLKFMKTLMSWVNLRLLIGPLPKQRETRVPGVKTYSIVRKTYQKNTNLIQLDPLDLSKGGIISLFARDLGR